MQDKTLHFDHKGNTDSAAIAPSTGEITVNNAGPLDFEARTSSRLRSLHQIMVLMVVYQDQESS